MFIKYILLPRYSHTSIKVVSTAVTPIVLGEMRTANILPFNRPQHATFENLMIFKIKYKIVDLLQKIENNFKTKTNLCLFHSVYLLFAEFYKVLGKFF